MSTSSYVSRINQFDAVQLDNEIYKLLKSQTRDIAREIGTPGIFDKWQAEIEAIIKIFVWKFTLHQGTSTIGQRLLNLQYTNMTQKKTILYLILSIVPQYLKNKLATENFSPRGETAKKLKALVDSIANVIRLIDFLNLLLFLHRGVRPRLIESLLRMNVRLITTQRPRNIGYSYMTRELLWHGLMELFTIGIPMINFHYIKNALARLWRRKNMSYIKLLPKMNVSTKCAYCGDNPILPSHAGCQHIFCYYCLQAHFTAMNMFLCPKCDTELHAQDFKYYEVATLDKKLDK